VKSTLRKPTASLRRLEWINFCIVQMAAAAFVVVYLSAMRYWSPAQVGIVVGAQNIATMLGQPFAGASIDRSERKRWLVTAATVIIAIGCVLFLITFKNIDYEDTSRACPERHILGTQLRPNRNGRRWRSTRKAQVTY
jgi:MFS family permease